MVIDAFLNGRCVVQNGLPCVIFSILVAEKSKNGVSFNSVHITSVPVILMHNGSGFGINVNITVFADFEPVKQFSGRIRH